MGEEPPRATDRRAAGPTAKKGPSGPVSGGVVVQRHPIGRRGGFRGGRRSRANTGPSGPVSGGVVGGHPIRASRGVPGGRPPLGQHGAFRPREWRVLLGGGAPRSGASRGVPGVAPPGPTRRKKKRGGGGGGGGKGAFRPRERSVLSAGHHYRGVAGGSGGSPPRASTVGEQPQQDPRRGARTGPASPGPQARASGRC